MNSHEKHERAQRGITAVLCLLAALLHSPSALAADSSAPASLLRIVGPVRLSPEPGPKLDSEVTQTRAILEKFEKGGFDRAVWAVDALPEKEKDIALWVKGCLKAFPDKPILALDVRLEDGKVLPAEQKLRVFLKASLSGVDSVLLNYSCLNNTAANAQEAIAAVQANADLVRNIFRKKQQWLYMDWEKDPAPETLSAWTNAFAGLVHGFIVQHAHECDVGKQPACAKAGAPLLASGKPVLRAGFRYASARPRPGLEDDLREQYRARVSRYEAWLERQNYAGYARMLGDAIPAALNVNLALMPEENALFTVTEQPDGSKRSAPP